MARRGSTTKEAIILAIDIGKNSSERDSDGKTYLEKSMLCASLLLKRKILIGSEDRFALILFGSTDTFNHLSSQGDCYANIETVTHLHVATWDLFNYVNRLSSTNITHSDWISTFVLGADLLKNETENEFFTGHQIIMFSNLSTDISFGNIGVIANCLKVENIGLTIIGRDCEAISLNSEVEVFIKKSEATAVNFDLVLPKSSYYKQKEVIARRWNAPLSFGEVFDIKVSGYEKIDITTKSSNWLFSKNYDTQDSTNAMNKPLDENGEQMDVDNHELGIDDFYCPLEIIPVIDLDTDECTYIVCSQRCLQVMGFTKTTNAQSSFLINGGSFIFKPHKTDMITFNAVFDFMVERKEVMLVRKIDTFINLLNVGVLLPQIEDNEKFFVYVNIPFDDKKFKYKFPSLHRIKSDFKEMKPKWLDAMDLDKDGNKFVMPELKYDFELQSLYDCIVEQMLMKVGPKNIDCLINTPKSIKEKAELPLNVFIKTFSLKQEVSEDWHAENKKPVQFVRYEESNVSNEFINPPKTIIENAEPDSKEFMKGFLVKQEVSEDWTAEDNKTMQFVHDEESNVSNMLINTPKRFMDNFEPPLKKFIKTFSVKQEVSEDWPAEDKKTVQFVHYEESNVSNEFINPPTTIIENAEPDSKEFIKRFSIKQEVSEDWPAEDNKTVQFFHNEESNVSNELTNPPKTIIENAEPDSKEFMKGFLIKQEVSEDWAAEDNKTVQFVHYEESNVSNELTNPPKTIIENAEPDSKEFMKGFLVKQEVSEDFSVENTIQFIGYNRWDFSKQCVISLLNPVKDFNDLLKNGFDSTIVCKKMQYATLNLIEFSTCLEDLKKPIATLMALREYCITNNDVKYYNNFMYLVKDAVLISGKQDHWSEFINSGIGLITNQEIEASDISQETSEEYMTLPADLDDDFLIDDDNPLKEFL